jgi:hypothetical protein
MLLQRVWKFSALALVGFLAIGAGLPREVQSADSSGAARSAPVGIGDPAPDFKLLDQDGRAQSLATERAKQDAVVLIFYRGHW